MDPTVPLLSAFSALIGAWAGAQVALSRFKKERGFDRRLDWYEKMFRCLYDLAIALEGALHYDLKGDREQAGSYWAKASSIFDPLSALCSERELYAKAAGHAAITRLVVEVTLVYSLDHQRDTEPTKATRDGARVTVRLLREAASILSDEVRDDLGWPRVKHSESPVLEAGA